MRFRACAVGAVELPDLNAYVVVLAADEDAVGPRIELQRSLTFDDQDRALGMDRHCLVTETGACAYGAVAAWDLVGDVLHLGLTSDGAEDLGVAEGFIVDLPPAAAEGLRAALARVFADDLPTPPRTG